MVEEMGKTGFLKYVYSIKVSEGNKKKMAGTQRSDKRQ